jgi:hypothetical protein
MDAAGTAANLLPLPRPSSLVIREGRGEFLLEQTLVAIPTPFFTEWADVVASPSGRVPHGELRLALTLLRRLQHAPPICGAGRRDSKSFCGKAGIRAALEGPLGIQRD